MFENLTERLNSVFKGLRRRGKLSPDDVDAALREVRLALLEADVHYGVVKDFIARVRERAVGFEVSKALNPAQQVIKIVNEELIATLGDAVDLNLHGSKPRVIMLVGLQGSGKTTAAAKIARRLQSKGERISLVAADPYRPAAIEQLTKLGDRLNVPVFSQPEVTPPELVRAAYEHARGAGITTLILDTAGRSQLDSELMDELCSITDVCQPVESLLVVDAMIGQEAVNIAQGFLDSVPLTGFILTKIDGDARGGAAISIRSVTGVPIKYLSTGESLDDLEKFEPDRLASRILGMGDMIGLIERAEATFDQETAVDQAERMISGDFTLEDFADQLRQIRKMGPIGQLLDMIPGGAGMQAHQVSPQDAEKQLKITEAIINSMTLAERRKPDILNASRRKRIARGSGTQVQDVNRLIKQYRQMQRMIKRLKKLGIRGMPRMFG